MSRVYGLPKRKRVKQFLSKVLLLTLALSVFADTDSVPKKAPALIPALPHSLGGEARAAWQTFPQPGSFVMALARDGMDNLWVGTEGNGVWRYAPNVSTNGQWTHYSQKSGVGNHLTPALSPASGGEGDGLGDDYAYSVAVDKQGRIWVGHLNHGVSVYNGTSWRNYDVPHGPIGERVFKIAVCPTDGDVWIGTSAGLTRYEVSKDEWKHYTRNAEGRMQNAEMGNQLPQLPTSNSYLPSDQISAIAFDKARIATTKLPADDN